MVAAQRQVIAAARGRFDVIILDTAPMLTANDAVELVGSVDLVLLVARIELTTHRQRANACVELLGRLDAPLGGVVLIGAPDDVERVLLLLPAGPDRREEAAPQRRPVRRGQWRTATARLAIRTLFGDAPATA